MKIGRIPAEDLLHAIFFEVIVEAAAAKIIADLPFLAWPGLNGLFRYCLNRLAGVFYDEQVRHVRFEIIDERTEAEASALQAAADELRVAAGLADEQGVKDATVKVRDALRALIEFEPASQ